MMIAVAGWPDDPAMRQFKFYLAIAMLLFIAWQSWLFRHRLARIFKRRPNDPAKLEKVRRQLDEIHEESALHIFIAKRAAEVELRGHRIVVVHGTEAVPSVHGSNSTSSVFTIGEGDETEWMKHFPDVFEIAFAGKRLTVFWIKLPTLLQLSETIQHSA